MNFAVVTRVPDPARGEAGNMALSIPYLATVPPGPDNGYLGRVELITRAMPSLGPWVVQWRAPVFVLGEVLLLDDDGREVAGNRRHPGKWDVDVEAHDELETAVRRAGEILDAEPV